MAKGLDVGTMDILSAVMEGDRITYATQRDVFMEMPKNEFLSGKLRQMNTLHMSRGDMIYILGDDALELAPIFHRSAKRPMQNGILSPAEKEAIPMIQLIIQRVLGKPFEENEKVFYSVPSDPIDSNYSTLYHQKVIGSLLRREGYDPVPINEGMAVVFSELSNNGFTGLSLDFGAGLTHAALSYYGTPSLVFSMTRGGDWIDEEVSRSLGVPREVVCIEKEKHFRFEESYESSTLSAGISIYYDALMDYVLDQLEGQLSRRVKVLDMEVPVVIAGGASMPKGFVSRVDEMLKIRDLPIEISSVKAAKDPIYSIVRGCLICAKVQEAGPQEEEKEEKEEKGKEGQKGEEKKEKSK
jgi:hypothetical protein